MSNEVTRKNRKEAAGYTPVEQELVEYAELNDGKIEVDGALHRLYYTAGRIPFVRNNKSVREKGYSRRSYIQDLDKKAVGSYTRSSPEDFWYKGE